MISIIVFLRNQMMNVRKTKKERYDILIIKLTSQTLTGIVNQSVDFSDGLGKQKSKVYNEIIEIHA